MNKDDLRMELADILVDVVPSISDMTAAVDKIVSCVDRYVESERIKARLAVMKNFRAV